MDIIATTSNPTMIKGVYQDALPVIYDAPKPEKKKLTRDDLFKADMMTFGSIIGSVTNKGSIAYALLPNIEEKYGRNSPEYALLESRLIQCCVAQSRTIDKAKIGRAVKGIPKTWVESKGDISPVLRNTLLNRYPYFFKYRYHEARKSYETYEAQKAAECKIRFGISVPALLHKQRRTKEEREWIINYREYAPLIDSKSTMNTLCHYLEGVVFSVMSECKKHGAFDWTVYMKRGVVETDADDIVKCYRRHIADMTHRSASAPNSVSLLREKMRFISGHTDNVVNVLVRHLYSERKESRKDLLWLAYGNRMVANLRENTGLTPMYPFYAPEGNIAYLGKTYEWRACDEQGWEILHLPPEGVRDARVLQGFSDAVCEA